LAGFLLIASRRPLNLPPSLFEPLCTYLCKSITSPASLPTTSNESVTTDTFFCDTPAHDDGILGHAGATIAQLYVGKARSKTVFYPMGLKSDMSKALEDLIRNHGAPNSLFSDSAKAQCSKHVLDILCLYGIKDFQSEPHHQHQNFAESKIGDTKRLTDAIMDRTGTQASFWLLCLLYVVFLLYHLASDVL
jgi:hypothetical protein